MYKRQIYADLTEFTFIFGIVHWLYEIDKKLNISTIIAYQPRSNQDFCQSTTNGTFWILLFFCAERCKNKI